jgi:acyl carrier protein
MATIENVEFLEKFSELFDETDPDIISLDTEFKKIEEWSSLIALSLIAMADEQYNVRLTGDEIRSATTIQSLKEIIESKLS